MIFFSIVLAHRNKDTIQKPLEISQQKGENRRNGQQAQSFQDNPICKLVVQLQTVILKKNFVAHDSFLIEVHMLSTPYNYDSLKLVSLFQVTI